MKKWTVLLVILITKISHAMDITCDVISCNYSDPAKISSQTVSSSGAYISSNLGETLNINLYNDSPKLMMSVSNPSDIDLTQTYRNTTAANTHTIISSKAGGLSVTAKGIKGINGVNSSKLCADRFKNGIYGVSAKNNFNSRHLSSSNVCDDTDINYLKTNNFSCDDGYTESSTSDVSLAIADQKRACRADITYNVCTKKSYDLSCRYYVSGPICCNDTNTKTFASWTKVIFPNLTFSNNCHADACTPEKNGIYFSKTIRGYGESSKTASTCNGGMNDLVASMSGGGATRSLTSTATSTTRNSIDLSSQVVIKNNAGIMLSSSEYRLMPINIAELKAASAEFKNCFGLDGSSETDYICDIKPGPAITIKLAAIRISNGHYSNEVSIDVSGNRYVTKLTTKIYKYYINGASGNTHNLYQKNQILTYNDNVTDDIHGYTVDVVSRGSFSGYTAINILTTFSRGRRLIDGNWKMLVDYKRGYGPLNDAYFVTDPVSDNIYITDFGSELAASFGGTYSGGPVYSQASPIEPDSYDMFPTFGVTNNGSVQNQNSPYYFYGSADFHTFSPTSTVIQNNVVIYADYDGNF